jgi:hypothetical protein
MKIKFAPGKINANLKHIQIDPTPQFRFVLFRSVYFPRWNVDATYRCYLGGVQHNA